MSSQIKTVQYTDPHFQIELEMGLGCNFNCRYCTQKPWRGQDNPKALELYLKNWYKIDNWIDENNIDARNFHLSLIGGETTLWPVADFVDKLMKTCKHHPSKVIIFTNGSRPNTLIELGNVCKKYHIGYLVSFSWHEDFMTIFDFIESIRAVQESDCATVLTTDASVVVNDSNIERVKKESVWLRDTLGMEMGYNREIKIGDNFEEIDELVSLNESTFDDIKKHADKIMEGASKEEFPESHFRYKGILKDGRVVWGFSIDDIEVACGGKIYTKGGKCDIGQRFLKTTQWGLIYSGYRRCGGKAANLFEDEKLDIGPKVVTCNQDRCVCFHAAQLDFPE